MQYGKISIEDGQLVFKKHMIDNSLPCCDILWAYRRRECEQTGEDRGKPVYRVQNFVIMVTRRGKRYKFEMSEPEAVVCLEHLRKENPQTAIGYPRGGRLPLVSLPNTRDLGALRTKEGKNILPRRLLRSGELYHVSRQDQKIFREEYRLSTVIDFRTEAERRKKPDTYMEGVRYIKLPILDEETIGITKDGNLMDVILNFKENGEAYMQEQYKALALDPYCADQYAKFFDCLLDHQDGAALWHCSAGKDRVGVGTALLLTALGVPRPVIVSDFMRTNGFLKEELDYLIRYLGAKGAVDETLKENIRILFQVKESYLNNVFDTIEEEYGTMDWYLRKRMYLTPKALDELQKKYLV